MIALLLMVPQFAHATGIVKVMVIWSQGQPLQAAYYRIYLCESPIAATKPTSCKGKLYEHDSRIPMAEIEVPVTANRGMLYARTSAVGYNGVKSDLSDQVSIPYRIERLESIQYDLGIILPGRIP